MSPRTMTPDDFNSREKELIALSRNLINEECLSTLTIDRIVAAAPYSKGTIYKHFTSKEDLILAICNSCMQELQALFTRALKFDGNSRERIVAVNIAYVIWSKLHPTQLFIVLSAHSPNVIACASTERITDHHNRETEMMGLLNVEISNAIKAGDLSLPEDMSFEQVTFALWSSTWGAMALITTNGESLNFNNMVLERESYTNVKLILDGFGWLPLSNQWDYSHTIKRIINELFQHEIDLLEKNNTPLLYKR